MKSRLRRRLLAAVTPLVVVSIIVAGVIVARSLGDAADATDVATLAETWADVNEVVGVLEQSDPDVPLDRSVGSNLDSILRRLRTVDAPSALTLVQRAITTLENGESSGDAQARSEARASVVPLLYSATSTYPTIVTDPGLAQDMHALSQLAEARTASLQVGDAAQEFIAGRVGFEAGLTQYEIASSRADRALLLLREIAAPQTLDRLDELSLFDAREAVTAEVAKLDLSQEVEISEMGAVSQAMANLIGAIDQAQTDVTDQIVETATDTATSARLGAITVAGIVLLTLVAAVFVTLGIVTSVAARVSAVSAAARRVSDEQLPALVQALRDPSGEGRLPDLPTVDAVGSDEVAELARSFASLQNTLKEVAGRQMDTLKKGVSDIFVTLARRNRSLVDRQLATLDRLEQHEEDPDTLADYYQLDHMATRMRRNAESLLVLAGTESQKNRRDALEIDDVIRAALGEVEDYQRIDVLALEALQLEGVVVSDLAHLLSELLENATAFSPPETRVRIAGHFHEGGYLITITDRGVGVSSRRLADLNSLLQRPPVLGLALDPTLGLYVVSMLAKRHGIRVRLVNGAPGVTAQVLVPTRFFVLKRDDSLSPVAEPVGHTASQQLSAVGAPQSRATPVRHERAPGESAADDPGLVAAPAASGLPVRDPGTTLSSDPDLTEDAVAASPSTLSPEQRRSALAGFQHHRTLRDGESNDQLGLDGPAAVVRTARLEFVRVPQDPQMMTSPNAQTSQDGLSEPAGSDGSGPSDLPTRTPGTSYSDSHGDQRVVESSGRKPEEIKAAFNSFQLGMTVGRNKDGT